MQLSGHKIFRILTTSVMFHKNNRKECQCGSTSIVQTETHSHVETVTKSNADSNKAIQERSVLWRKFNHKYQLVFNRGT